LLARLIFPVLALCIVLALTVFNENRDQFSAWLPLLLLVVVFFVGTLSLPYRQKKEIRSHHPEWLNPITCEIGEREIVMRTSNSEVHYEWKDIGEVLETANTLYFLFSDKKRYLFFPKRAFTSSQQMEDFRALWQRMVQPIAKA
ncbi:YcxB family protein, partial [bacterium]